MQDARVAEGHPMLNGAAVEAVRQWRYLPTVKDGNAVSVTTMVEVFFKMGSSPPVILQGPGIRIN